MVLVSDLKKNELMSWNDGRLDADMLEVMRKAFLSSCIVIGLPEVVRTLSYGVDKPQFCVLAQPDPGDNATHLLEVLLEAYCNEHDIRIFKVADAEMLSSFLNVDQIVQCALIKQPSELIVKPLDVLVRSKVEDRNQRLSVPGLSHVFCFKNNIQRRSV